MRMREERSCLYSRRKSSCLSEVDWKHCLCWKSVQTAEPRSLTESLQHKQRHQRSHHFQLSLESQGKEWCLQTKHCPEEKSEIEQNFGQGSKALLMSLVQDFLQSTVSWDWWSLEFDWRLHWLQQQIFHPLTQHQSNRREEVLWIQTDTCLWLPHPKAHLVHL